MAKTFTTLFVFAVAAAGALAFQQKFTLYELPDQQGDSISFTGKYPNLSNWTFFLNKAQSYCQAGWFMFFDQENFEYVDSYFGEVVGTNICRNHNFFGQYKSGRIQGPAELFAPALTLNEGTGIASGGGREIVITTAASTNFEFVPIIVASYGNSSWTLFNETNFGGSSTCFKEANNSFGMWSWTPNSSFPVQSVIKGCNPADVEYYRNLYA